VLRHRLRRGRHQGPPPVDLHARRPRRPAGRRHLARHA